MSLWMTVFLLFCSRALSFGRRIPSSNPPFGIQRHSYAAAFSHTPNTSLRAVSSPSTPLFAKQSQSKVMRGVKKENLPSKVCVVCNRPFTWRKKWERCWDEVTTCSKSCNSKRKGRNNKYKSDAVKEESSDLVSHRKEDRTRSMLTANFENVNIDRNDDDANEDCEHELEDLFENVNHDIVNDAQSVSSQNSPDNYEVDSYDAYPCLDSRARRKEEKKRMKAERRAQREGRGDPSAGQKQCTICNKSVNLLIRCTYDSTEEWGMVCGKCWKDVSGGVVDGDSAHPHYRYGGLWKNRRAQRA